jgi:hypothetical protein
VMKLAIHAPLLVLFRAAILDTARVRHVPQPLKDDLPFGTRRKTPLGRLPVARHVELERGGKLGVGSVLGKRCAASRPEDGRGAGVG